MNDFARVVAAFDFDGTLTQSDTLYGFLRRLCGIRALATAATAQFPSLATAAAGRGDRDVAKAALLARLLAGRSLVDVDGVVADYVEWLLASRLRTDVVARAAWHREQGHELIVVSASPEIYVRPVAERLGFASTLATRLEVADGVLTGRLVGGNVRGPEKVSQVRAWLGDGSATLWAYGNSSSDRPLLDAADVAVWVGRESIAAAG